MNENIQSVREKLVKGKYEVETEIKGLEVWFSEKKVENVTDGMIEFAINLANDYLQNKEKYEEEVIDVVRIYVEDISDESIINQIGTPIVNIATEKGGSLMFEGIKELGDHMPEVIVTPDLRVVDVALNG